ncbi:DivIVA domain-containing protein [Mycoplasma procyoni]|uniref:DivIVA domain-containing protein n=1 Tax=Mycoplasma procyoni TaxID=568784 RepID=UPI00197CACA0|nr:DivIVA domain-containing protein [Mycoplasma procyoni]MBN3534766.1 DivIVA domain-containing protein [Mycoplasma procyoni]
MHKFIEKIVDKKFSVAINGYDPTEVDSFIDNLINEFRKLDEQNKQKEKEISELIEKLKQNEQKIKELEMNAKQTENILKSIKEQQKI